MEETGNDHVKINTELFLTCRNTHTCMHMLDMKAEILFIERTETSERRFTG